MSYIVSTSVKTKADVEKVFQRRFCSRTDVEREVSTFVLLGTDAESWNKQNLKGAFHVGLFYNQRGKWEFVMSVNKRTRC